MSYQGVPSFSPLGNHLLNFLLVSLLLLISHISNNWEKIWSPKNTSLFKKTTQYNPILPPSISVKISILLEDEVKELVHPSTSLIWRSLNYLDLEQINGNKKLFDHAIFFLIRSMIFVTLIIIEYDLLTCTPSCYCSKYSLSGVAWNSLFFFSLIFLAFIFVSSHSDEFRPFRNLQEELTG